MLFLFSQMTPEVLAVGVEGASIWIRNSFGKSWGCGGDFRFPIALFNADQVYQAVAVTDADVVNLDRI